MRSLSRFIIRFCLPVLLLAAGSGHAQELTLPAPLALKASEPQPGNSLAMQISAQRALEMGFPSIAADLFQRLLDNPATRPELRSQLTIDLVTALLDEDRTDDASAVMKKFIGLPTPAFRLRLALVALREKRYDEAKTTAGTLTAEELPASDRSWFYFLQGMLVEVTTRDVNRSGALYQQAIEAAPQDSPQRTRFILAREQAKLVAGEFSEPRGAEYHQHVEKDQGQQLYYYVKLSALNSNALGKKSEAVTLLQRQLQSLPSEERATADEWRLLLGLISGADEGVGRSALGVLLANGSDRAKQRVALQLLARSSHAGTPRDDFRRRLDELIGAATAHPLLEDLLLFRAQLALGEKKDYSRAEADATRLLEQFPGSQFKGLALGVLTGVAWEQGRYRNAANQATKAREVLSAGEAHAQLGVLVAEAWFRAGISSHSAPDFRNAADAYAAALNEVPTGVAAGPLMFQQLVSEIEVANADEGRADRFARPQALLDQMAPDARLDTDNRWKAEWNLARALEAAGDIAKAYDRLKKLMASPADATNLPVDLKAQLGWLQASLSFKAGDSARTLTLSGQLLESLEGTDPVLRSQIASMIMLLQAQANFALNPPNTEAALERLRKLRAEYPKADAAMYSYIVEADYDATHGQLVEAQGLLRNLADQYRTSSYAPYALYQAAQYAERRAQENYLKDAYRILENLVKDYPQSDLVFYARLKQGNLLRLLNDNGGAQPIFEQLVNEFPQHQGVLAARLALADCHAAQATSDASHQESAATIYEALLDLQGAPLDIRAEAGYKYGLGLARRGSNNKALEVWSRVFTSILPDGPKSETLGPKGRFWLSKTLIWTGDLFVQLHKPEQAREAYDLIISRGLPFATQAQERLTGLRSQKVP